MPRVVYGVMTFHPSHEITVPAPQLTAALGVPNACNQCHMDKSVNWAIGQTRRLWPDRYRDSSPVRDGAFDLPEGPRALFMGDAVMRALAADTLAGNGPMMPDPAWASPYLVEAFADNYPIVRFFAANGLKAHFKDMAKPDYLGTAPAREAEANAWRSVLGAEKLAQARQLADVLKRQRKETDLEVGE